MTTRSIDGSAEKAFAISGAWTISANPWANFWTPPAEESFRWEPILNAYEQLMALYQPSPQVAGRAAESVQFDPRPGHGA